MALGNSKNLQVLYFTKNNAACKRTKKIFWNCNCQRAFQSFLDFFFFQEFSFGSAAAAIAATAAAASGGSSTGVGGSTGGGNLNSLNSGGNGSSVGGKMPTILRDFLSTLDDKEWESELYKLLQNQSFNQVEVDLFELLCKVLDQNLFAQVDWARNSFYFRELEVSSTFNMFRRPH